MSKRKSTAAVADEALETFRCPESTNIEQASYSPTLQLLTITFKVKAGQKPRAYRYACVPRALWEEFKAEALSKGKFFAYNIKPYYPSEPV